MPVDGNLIARLKLLLDGFSLLDAGILTLNPAINLCFQLCPHLVGRNDVDMGNVPVSDHPLFTGLDVNSDHRVRCILGVNTPGGDLPQLPVCCHYGNDGIRVLVILPVHQCREGIFSPVHSLLDTLLDVVIFKVEFGFVLYLFAYLLTFGGHVLEVLKVFQPELTHHVNVIIGDKRLLTLRVDSHVPVLVLIEVQCLVWVPICVLDKRDKSVLLTGFLDHSVL